MRLWPVCLILVLLAAITPCWAGTYLVYVMSLALVMAIGAVGLDILMGYAGQVCFGQAGFMAIGAYVTAYLVKAGLTFWVSWPIGGIAAGLAGLAVGVPSMRIKGHYLALATLSFAYIIYLTLVHWESVTGGPRGMVAVRPDWPVSFKGDASFFLLVLGTTILMVILARNIVNSKYGRAFIALQKDEIVSKSMGINLLRYKTLAFILSSVFGGIAGGLFGPLVGFLDPLSFSMLESAYFMLIVLMGGRGTLFGGILGAFIFVAIPELVRRAEHLQEAIYGFIFLIILIYMPHGIIGVFIKHRSFFMEQIRKVRLLRAVFETGALHREAAGIGGSSSPFVHESSPKPDERPEVPLLRLDHVTIKFGGIMALNDLTFALRPGEIFSLIGPNGAGKTTALNVITRLYDPLIGEAVFRNENLLSLGPDRIIGKGISRTFQNVGLLEGVSTLENVMVGLHSSGRSGFFHTLLKMKTARQEEVWRRDRALAALTLVRMEHAAYQMATDLPYGQQKMVSLARALVSRPRLLILDEPAAGLSRMEGRDLVSLIRRLCDETGCTILLVEHDMDIVMGVSDRIFVLNFGSKIAEGRPEEIRKNPLVLEAYLGAEVKGKLLAIDNIDVYYSKVRALHGITIHVKPKGIIALLGANGAGKTTTLRSVCGLLKPAKGEITLKGEQILGLPPEQIVKRGISMVCEGRRLFAEMTVLENLEVGAFIRRDRSQVNDLQERIYRYFPILKERRSQRAASLSGGEQQMLAIGRALMSSPKLLLLDEPSLGLAPLIVADIFRIVEELNEEDMTILLVEQNARMALNCAHEAYVLETGRVVLRGTPEELLSDQAFYDAYLGASEAGKD